MAIQNVYPDATDRAKQIIPLRKVKEMLQIANEMNKHDAYQKK